MTHHKAIPPKQIDTEHHYCARPATLENTRTNASCISKKGSARSSRRAFEPLDPLRSSLGGGSPAGVEIVDYLTFAKKAHFPS